MNKVRKLSINLLISLLVLTNLMFNFHFVSAETYQNVNVLVAYDEEMAFTARWTYGYSPETFCKIIIDTVSDRFKSAFRNNVYYNSLCILGKQRQRDK